MPPGQSVWLYNSGTVVAHIVQCWLDLCKNKPQGFTGSSLGFLIFDLLYSADLNLTVLVNTKLNFSSRFLIIQ